MRNFKFETIKVSTFELVYKITKNEPVKTTIGEAKDENDLLKKYAYADEIISIKKI